MRMRPKKNRDKRMDAVKDWFIQQDENGVAMIDSSYDNNNELFLEIGCGKGAFITGLSKQYPENRLLAVELVPDVLMMAMEKAGRENASNVRFLHANAENIADIIPEGSVSRLYLNFSDPWPKKRNAKRRLTSPLFLERYKKLVQILGNNEYYVGNVCRYWNFTKSICRSGNSVGYVISFLFTECGNLGDVFHESAVTAVLSKLQN